jgi:hypothetical protein
VDIQRRTESFGDAAKLVLLNSAKKSGIEHVDYMRVAPARRGSRLLLH